MVISLGFITLTDILYLLDRTQKILLGYMIWVETYGNGVKIIIVNPFIAQEKQIQSIAPQEQIVKE